ncbi:MAG: glycoside hydrolase family 32 protein [bacterium]
MKIAMRGFWMACGLTLALGAQCGETIFADFEGETYGAWTTEGTAFGTGPARGTLKGQMKVDDFQGKGFVNSFLGGDGAVGKLTSPVFTVNQKFITFLIGGGGFDGKTCMNLLVGNKVVRTATGPNVNPGGSEALEPGSWDVSDLVGKEARIQIVDHATGGWGHINVDQIAFSDKPTAVVKKNMPKEREMTIDKRYLHFPIHNGTKKGKKQRVAVLVDGVVVREFDADLSEEPDWYAHLDMSAWKGKKATIRVDKVPEDSKLLERVAQADTIWNAEQLYKEPLRGQLRFSPRRGWNNDPNGMVYADGEYHLYFQANPYGWPWGNMHWGHAVSKDMVHWEELPIAIYPQKFGDWVFSGGAVVDKDNTSGWKKGKNELIVATYTSTGRGECIVYSNDRGRTFQEFEGNPIIKHGGRDPRPLWYAPGKHWVIAVYDEFEKGQYVAFYTSTDMKTWTFQSRIKDFFECADLFELPVGGKKYWVLTAANSDYRVGQFDGKTFTPETPKLKGHRGRGFYAAQTFSHDPQGRIVQIGWLQTATPGMPFNQAMSLPNELRLRQTAEGPRLTWTPVKELESLRDGADQGAALANFKAELMEIRVSFEPGDAEVVDLTVRGVQISVDIKKQEITVNGHCTPAPLIDGKQDITVYVDKTALEIFASDGLVYIPLTFAPKAEDLSVSVEEKGGKVKGLSLKAYKLKSCWSKE